MAKTTLKFGQVYSKNNTYEHSNQILHIPEINDTTSTTFLSTYGFTGTERVTNLSVQLPLRVGTQGMGKTFNNLRIVIFNGFTGTVNNSSSSTTAWFSVSNAAPNVDNMLIKWESEEEDISSFVKSAIDAGKLIGTPLAYIDTSFTSASGVYEYIQTFDSSNSTITILEAGKDINNWAPKGYKPANGYGLFIGFYNTATNFWSDTAALGAGAGLNWGRYGTSTDPYAYVTLTTGSTIKYHNGTEWKDCEVYYHNGSGWQQCEVQYHDGSAWKTIGS